MQIFRIVDTDGFNLTKSISAKLYSLGLLLAVVLLVMYVLVSHVYFCILKCRQLQKAKNSPKKKNVLTQTDVVTYTTHLSICPNKSLINKNVLINENYSENDFEDVDLN